MVDDDEVLEYLCLQPGSIILDCTVGGGGHAGKIMDRIKPDGCLIGIDKDFDMLNMTKECLSDRGCPFKLYHADYVDADEVLRQAGIDGVHGVLLDLVLLHCSLIAQSADLVFLKKARLI